MYILFGFSSLFITVKTHKGFDIATLLFLEISDCVYSRMNHFPLEYKVF